MTREEAIKFAEYAQIMADGKPDVQEFYKLAEAALRQQEQERNEPLSLGELLHMNGEPVWIVEYPDWGHWELSADAGDYVAERDYDSYGMMHDDPAGRYGLHKLGWLAFRQKPVEKDHGV